MERCQSCSACFRNCPSAAITSERCLLRAELSRGDRPSCGRGSARREQDWMPIQGRVKVQANFEPSGRVRC